MENIKLNDLTKQRVISAFDKGLQNYPRKNTQSKLTEGSYEKNSFPEAHVVVFIADQLMAMRKDLVIGWLGTQGEFKASLQKILLSNGIKPSFINLSSLNYKKECDVVIFRNKLSRNYNIKYNRSLFFRLVNYIYSLPAITKNKVYIY